MADPATILIVDDYPASRYALARMMRQLGHRTIELGSGAALLAELERVAADLMILDVHLPDADGFELCDLIRKDPRHQQLPIIVVSATYSSPDHQQRVQRCGADAYFEQPVVVEQRAAEVRRLLARRSA